MISQGVEISIAGGVGGMVHAYLLVGFFKSFILIFYIMYSLLRYKNLHTALAIV